MVIKDEVIWIVVGISLCILYVEFRSNLINGRFLFWVDGLIFVL